MCESKELSALNYDDRQRLIEQTVKNIIEQMRHGQIRLSCKTMEDKFIQAAVWRIERMPGMEIDLSRGGVIIRKVEVSNAK